VENKKVSVEIGKGLKHDKPASVLLGSGPVRISQVALADIVFVIDTTGSMNDKIDGLLKSCQKFVDELGKRRIDWRVAVISFGDLTIPGDKIQATEFSNSIDTVKNSLQNIPRNSGGANTGESSFEALLKAAGLDNYRHAVIKVFILITDEPALQSNQVDAKSITVALKSKGALTFVIAHPEDYYKSIAQATGGTWFQISSDTDFLSVLDILSQRVSQVVSDVQRLAAGNVQKYLELTSGR
jgi:uncharacterized protein YegL